ncbi:MAG TPA: glycoside hydrolase family 13, partial [Anaerolineae bacterium]|nr:glycoside hydrolase family 13 [Anaerolineae bacterium]
MIEKAPANKAGMVRVTFLLPSNMWAERLNLVGEFNDWDSTATPMIRSRTDANWRATVELARGRRYK